MDTRILRFAAQRLAKGIAVIVGVAILAFFLVRLAPGDPVSLIAGQSGAADAKFMADLRQQFGLDRSMAEQLLIYLGKIVQLDLGYSYPTQRTVSSLIAERLPATLLLTVTAFLISLGGGITLGAIAARRVGTWVDSTVTLLALAFYAFPVFWVGLIFILFFSVWLDILPALGMATIVFGERSVPLWLDVAHHLVLPATTLSLFYLALYARLTRSAMLEVASQDFVRTARAKGLFPSAIWRRHVLRNAILPITSFAGIQAGQLVGGSILVETVFSWPGIGRLAFEALLSRDYNLLLGIFIVTTGMAVFFNVLTDLAYAIVDPRIQTA